MSDLTVRQVNVDMRAGLERRQMAQKGLEFEAGNAFGNRPFSRDRDPQRCFDPRPLPRHFREFRADPHRPVLLSAAVEAGRPQPRQYRVVLTELR